MPWTDKQLQALDFEKNQCVIAGAGSGKTMTLVELILRLLEGATPDSSEKIEISNILALTYTEKAAREMRDRIRISLNDRIENDPDNHEYWLKQRHLLDRAQISTIHSFCLKILRQYGLEAGLDPDFNVLDADRDFLADAHKEALLDLLEQEDEDLIALLDYFPWLSRGRSRGLDSILTALSNNERTFGRSVKPAGINPGPLDEALDDLHRAVDMIDEFMAAGKIKPGKAYFDIIAKFVARAKEILDNNSSDIDKIADLQDGLKGNWYAAKPARDLASASLAAFVAERDRRLALPLKENLLSLSRKIGVEIDTIKENAQLLDFDDLLLKTRDMLARNANIRAILKQTYRVVMVDEFQDTNRLQADILAFIVEPENLFQAVDFDDLPTDLSAMDVLPMEERRLVVFGDPKQSIYRFRGAEVGVFQRLKHSISTSGGSIIDLNKNFRSQKKLVDFYNKFFSAAMTGDGEFNTGFTSLDVQKWARKDNTADPAVSVLNIPPGGKSAEERSMEAYALAEHINSLLAGQKNVLVTDQGLPPKPADIAILLRRFTHLKVYEQALQKLSLPYYTVRGRGFYQCQEVFDLINLMFFLADPQNSPALLGILRSPLIGLTDDSITRMAWPGYISAPIDICAYFNEPVKNPPADMPEEQKNALTSAQALFANLSAMSGRSFTHELIEAAIEETQYLAVLLSGRQGEQKVANVKRFIEILRKLPGQALYCPIEASIFLKKRLADQKDDPEAAASAEEDRSIRIMTIHQAKGLQFPIVIIPDSGQKAKSRGGKGGIALFGPDSSLTIRFKDPLTGQKIIPGDYQLLSKEEEMREREEHLRLLYVAATRACDHLVFSGTVHKTKGADDDSWLAKVNAFAADHPEMVKSIVPDEQLPSDESISIFNYNIECSHENVGEGSGDGPMVDAFRRAFFKPSLQAHVVNVTATGLAQYLTCPRQYFMEQILGLPQKNVNGDSDRGDALTPREKGLVFHLLMEYLDLKKDPEIGELEKTAAEKAFRFNTKISRGESNEIARRIMEFAQNPWGRDMFRSRDNLVQRETPVWLKIDSSGPGPDMILTGEIDLFYVTPEKTARVIDYKYAEPEKAKRYEPQIRAYALALKKAGLSSRLEAGLYFAAEEKGIIKEILFNEDWDRQFEILLQKTAEEIGVMTLPGAAPPERRETCPNPGCGWEWACHNPGFQL